MRNSQLTITTIKIFFITFVAAIAYLNLSGIHHQSDDFFFSQASRDSNTIEWLILRYNTWSSRTPIEYALITLINHKIAWSVFNSLFIGLTFSCVAYLISTNTRQAAISALIFLVALMCSLKKGFLKDGAIWMTGSINYLWPVALSLLGFSLIKYYASENKNIYIIFITSLAFFFSSFNEQVVVVNIILLITIIAFRIKGVEKITVISLAFTALVLIFILTCPGNEVRFISEVNHQYPDFMELGLFSKVLLGVNLSFDQLTIVQPVTLIIFYASLFFISSDKKGKYLAFFLLVTMFTLVIVNRLSPFVPPHTTVKIFNPISILEKTSFYRALILAAISLTTCITIFFALPQGKKKFYLIIVYISSFSGTVMLGLSPTLYASGERIFYFSCIMICALTAYFVTHGLQATTNKK